MTRKLRIAAVTFVVLPVSLAIWSCQADTEGEAPATEEDDFRLRSDVEAALPARAEAFAADPDDDDARRAYADILYKLGNVYEADEVIAPLGSASSSHVGNLQLAARMAYLLGDYGRAETLFSRLMELTEEGSEDHDSATQGLTLTWYQTNRFARAGELPTPEEMDPASSLLTFMQAFEGEPYGIEWATDDRITHLEMTNDITQPGALPLVDLEVNGQTVSLILDTGGDRLYLDKDIYAGLGLTTLANREARYAYTGGQTVEEPLGVAETVTMGDVTFTNVPVVGATWKALGQTSDGVLTTQMLKQFLSTMDYDNRRITLRERTPEALAQVMETFERHPAGRSALLHDGDAPHVREGQPERPRGDQLLHGFGARDEHAHDRRRRDRRASGAPNQRHRRHRLLLDLDRVARPERPREGRHAGDGQRLRRRGPLLAERLHDGRPHVPSVPLALRILDDRLRQP